MHAAGRAGCSERHAQRECSVGPPQSLPDRMRDIQFYKYQHSTATLARCLASGSIQFYDELPWSQPPRASSHMAGRRYHECVLKKASGAIVIAQRRRLWVFVVVYPFFS